MKILARTIFTGKNYFCRQKLFLPVWFLPQKIPVFSTNWQKLANPDLDLTLIEQFYRLI